MPMALSSFSTECIVFNLEGIPAPEYRLAYRGGTKILPHTSTPFQYKPTVQEQMYAITLHQQSKSNPLMISASRAWTDGPLKPGEESKSVPHQDGALAKKPGADTANDVNRSSLRRTPKFSLIKHIEDYKFYDLVGLVVKTYPSNNGTLEIYITDFTTNGQLFHYVAPLDSEESMGVGQEGDGYNYLAEKRQKQWPGPYGKMTLQVTMWHPHSEWTRSNVKEGDFVLLRNVQIKTSFSSRLEGALREDRQFPTRVHVEVLGRKDDDVKAIKHRQQEYWAKLNSSTYHTREVQPGGASKRNRKAKKRQKAAERLASTVQQAKPNAPNTNQHVKCAYENIPISSLTDILESPFLNHKTPSGLETRLPFVNLKCRLRVRVVDFFPSSLEDFSHDVDDESYKRLSGRNADNTDEDSSQMDTSSDSMSDTGQRWEWAFYLLVEDARSATAADQSKPAQLPLLVAQQDAVHLLKMDATDLRYDVRALAELREKLFILWGNLADVKEGKEQTVSSRVFECCVKEYGVKEGGKWKRIHRLCATTIS